MNEPFDPETWWYIREVEDGIVTAVACNGNWLIDIPIDDIPECQRSYLGLGVYFCFVNGYVLIYKDIWTTHELEQADKKAKELARYLKWD